MEVPGKVRIDKYLWSVRIYKSRSLATEACRDGKVKINGQPAKSSAMVSPGDILDVHKEGFRFRYKVVGLIEKRVSALLAKPHYEDITPAEELNKYKTWFTGKAAPERREKGAGRPTKKERREIEEFKDFDDDDITE